MGFLDIFGNVSKGFGDAGDSYYTNSPLLGAYRDLTYEECRDIYRYWPLGKRVASALPDFAMSAPRKFFVKDAPEEVNSKLLETANEMEIDQIVKKATLYARIYGLSALFVTQQGNKKVEDPLTHKDIQNNGVVFNVLDPLSMGGSIQIDNDPLSSTFSKPIDIKIRGNSVHTQRVEILYNDIPLYYKFNPSSFSFSGPSIYQNMTLLIRAWNRGIIALQRLATKAAAMVKTTKESANVTGFSQTAAAKNLELIRSMENDGIASLRSGDTIEFFTLTGVQEVDTIIQQLNTGLMMALSDTPSGILLDKNLSVGLNDGSEDMKAILMAVDNFRLRMLKPLYLFTDKFLCYKAFSFEFIKEMIDEYPDLYRGKKENEVLTEWCQNYSFDWGELYPQSDGEKADTEGKRLDNLLKLKEMGADISCLEDAVNQLGYFDIDFVFKEENIQDGNEDSHGAENFDNDETTEGEEKEVKKPEKEEDDGQSKK